MPSRHVAVLAALALTGALVLAAPASAAPKHKTRVVVSLKTPAFHGGLKSAKPGCKARRTVRLYRVRRGPDKVLKRDRSNRRGRWSTPIGKRLVSGTYYAKAVARGRCKAGRSRYLVIP